METTRSFSVPASRSHLIYLILLSVFCFLILAVRMIYTCTFEYRFMGVNLLLAWIPYWFSILCVRIPTHKWRVAKITLFFLWLIFFPNAAYMITDIFHLSEFPSMPMWYDLILLLSFAWCGILLGFYSLRKMQRHFLGDKNMVIREGSVFLLFFIGGVGIYLGRYQRWNSWDLLLHPATLFSEFNAILSNRIELFTMLSLGILFAVLLTFIYVQLFSFQRRRSDD